MNLTEHIRENFTHVKPCCVEGAPDAHTAWLKVGPQSFCVTHMACDTKDEAEWYRTQLATALGNMVDTLPPWLLPKEQSLSDGGKG